MTTVTRLKLLLEELEKRRDKQILMVWKEIFGLSTIFEVYGHLFNVAKEINLLEQEFIQNNLINNADFKNIIDSFKGIVNYTHITQRLEQISYMNPTNIIKLNVSLNSLETMNNERYLRFKYEDEVDEEEFNNFKSSIKETIEKIENSNMPDEEKRIFLSIFYDLNKAISLYKINGLDAFLEVIQNNLCKIMIINEFKDKESKYDGFKNILLKSLQEVWFWIKMYQKTDTTLKLAIKAYGYLKDNIPKLTEEDISDDE